jgi:hypothetical protein
MCHVACSLPSSTHTHTHTHTGVHCCCLHCPPHCLPTQGQTVAKGTKVSRGYYSENGPPTTLSGTGKDLSLSYQHFTAIDDVQFVNGNQLGTRMLFQVGSRQSLVVICLQSVKLASFCRVMSLQQHKGAVQQTAGIGVGSSGWPAARLCSQAVHRHGLLPYAHFS